MFDIDWTILAAILFSAFMMGRLSKPRRVKLTPAQVSLETTPLDDMTDEQRALHNSYRTVEVLMGSSTADPTWEAFMLAAQGGLYLPNNVTVDHLMGGGSIKRVHRLIAEAFCDAAPQVAIA